MLTKKALLENGVTKEHTEVIIQTLLRLIVEDSEKEKEKQKEIKRI